MWGELADLLIYSNGVDNHKIYAGEDNYIIRGIRYDHTAAADSIPKEGFDYTDNLTDGDSTTVAVFDNLGTDSDQCFYYCSPVPINRLTFTVTAANANNVSSELAYRKSDGTWALTQVTSDANDGTNTGTTTLAQSGTMYWNPPSDEIPHYQYGVCGFWYRHKFDAALDAEVEVSEITYGTDHDGSGARTAFLSLVNTWDGLTTDPIDVIVYEATDAVYYTFGSNAVDLGGVSFDESDAIYIASYDKLQGVYIDPGNAPNTGDATAIDAVYAWDKDGWQSVSNLEDKTAGLSKPGWVTWGRPSLDERQNFENTQYYAHWYKIEVDDAVSTGTLVSIECMPYFAIDEQGNGVANCPWQDRMCYSFDRFGQYIHVSSRDRPSVLNGVDYGVLEAGDGRNNQVNSMTKFHNELIAWQEEKGLEGGTTTLFEGYSPGTYGKLLLSSKVGIVNANAFSVVDGVLTSTATDERIKTLVFWISRYGVCVSDGMTVAIISDQINNYFDPTESECIRRGYENLHWLDFDSAFSVLRIGLVSGSSATVPNVFLCFDLIDKVWYFDTPAQELSCHTEVEASSGDLPVLQYGGGVDDGFVYRLNTGQNDVDTAINSYLDIELSYGGEFLVLRELLLRCKAQAAGEITITIYGNKVQSIQETASMTAENTNEEIRRNLLYIDVIDQLITVRLQHNTASQDMYLYDLGVMLDRWDGR
jgi:hypothetical protein